MTGNAYGNPVLLKEGSPAVSLRRIDLTSASAESGYDEAFIQNLVFEHPECLPVDEIDSAYQGLIPVCTELYTPSGYLDALYVTASGRLAVLEAKLWRNPEARRKVVAQILDYASELATWDYDDLQREVSRRLGRPGNALYELVSELNDDIDEARFVDAVQKSLRTGRFLLLIVGDGIREGAATIASFLEQYGRLDFTFGLVELELHRLGESDTLVLPRVVARTVTIDRQVISLPKGFSVTTGPEASEEEDESPSEADLFYPDFWHEFINTLSLDDPGQPVPSPAKSTNLYFVQPPAGSVCWISAYFSKSKNVVGVYLTFTRGSFGDFAYQRLHSESEVIDEELALPVEWSSHGGKHTVTHRKSFPNVWSQEHREEIKDHLAKCVNAFVNAFRPRLQRLAEESDAR